MKANSHWKNWMSVLGFVLLGTLSTWAQEAPSNRKTYRLLDRIFDGQKVPENFDILIKQLAQKLEKETGQRINVLREGIDGRSLDEDHDSTQFPRELVVFSSGNNSLPHLFVGFAPTKGRLELIAFDPQKGWDFALAEPFHPSKKGRDIVVGTSSNRLCSSCHQAEAPIFSRFPWNETRGTNRDGVFSKAAKALWKSKNEDQLKLQNFSSSKLIATTNPLLLDLLQDTEISNPPFGFDSLVRTANRMAQTSRVCRTLCEKSDSHCWTRLFALIVSPVSQLSEKSSGRSDFSEFENWIKGPVRNRWPKDRFAYSSSVLLDRKIEKGTDGFTTFFQVPKGMDPHSALEDIFSEESAAREPAPGNVSSGSFRSQDIPGYRIQIQGSNSRVFDHPGNPQTQRPLINPIGLENPFVGGSDSERVLIPSRAEGRRGQGRMFPAFLEQTGFGLASFAPYSCLGLSTSDLTAIQDHLTSRGIRPLSNQGLKMLDENKELQEALKQGLKGPNLVRVFGLDGDTEACNSCALENFGDFYAKPSRDPLQKISGEILDQIQKSRQKASELATKHCSDCHGPDSPIPLPLQDGKKLAAYKSKKGQTPEERISRQEMPPAAYRSVQKVKDSNYEKELEELSRYLEAAAREPK